MSDKEQIPFEFFTSVETNKILKIALIWSPKEVMKLQRAIHSQFDVVISAVQHSSDFAEFFYKIVGGDKDPYGRQFTLQEINQFRKHILVLINTKTHNKEDEEEEYIYEEHGSEKLEKLADVIQELYTSSTYISNMELLSTSASDFFKLLSTEAPDRNDDESDCSVEDDTILAGDMSVLKTLKSIISSYIKSLDRIPKKNLDNTLRDEKNSGIWSHMGIIVTAFKKFSIQSGMMDDVSEMSFDFTSSLESVLESWDSYLIQMQKLD